MRFIDNLADYLKTITSEPPEILTVNKLRTLKWMSPEQLAAIFRNKRQLVRVADDPNAYRELKWFSAEQLRAIFGRENKNE